MLLVLPNIPSALLKYDFSYSILLGYLPSYKASVTRQQDT